MSETAATCPTLRRALEKIRTLTGGGCYDCMMAEPNRCPRCAEIDETVDTALATPAPDPLTALERAVMTASDSLVTETDAIDAKYQANPMHTLNFGPEIEARKTLINAVRAWRAAKQEAPR